jgi:anti-sigma-K factor RskA
VAEREASEKVTDLGEYKARRDYTGLLALVASVAILLLGLWGWTSYSALLEIGRSVHIPPGYTVLNLKAQKGYEGVSAVALYNPDKNDVVFIGGGLPQLPENQVYELWFLNKTGNPAPAGVFKPDSTGSAAHTAVGAQTMADYAGFAVTVEPSPGVTAPTGNAVVAGTYAAP